MILSQRALSVGICTVAILLGGPIASAQDVVSLDDLRAIERQIESDRTALEAIEAAQNSARADMTIVNRQLLAAAQESLRREEQASKIETKLIDLEVSERIAREKLMTDRDGLQHMITALIGASRRKPPTLATHPDKATNAIQAAIVIRDMANMLEKRADDLRVQVREYAVLRTKVEKEQARLQAAEKLLSAKEEEIQRLAAVKRAAFEDISGEAETLKIRMEAAAQKATTIKAVLDEIIARAPRPPSRKPTLFTTPSKKPGRDNNLSIAVLKRLGLPAAGQIVQDFGDNLQGGNKAEGLKVRTRAAAQVVAPADSEIVWSGPFRSYGMMLILRTGDGYHIVLSGLASIYGTQGQSVLAGEPVGKMSERTDVTPELYMELRKDGTPQDPTKWMSQSKG